MSNHRGLRMAEAIREVVSEAILFAVSDPRVRGVTILNVELSQDLRSATILYSVMGSESEKSQAVRGLQSATGYLQSLVAARLQTRFTPVLKFERDEGIPKSVEMSKLIDDVIAQDRQGHGSTDPKTPADEPDIDEESFAD